MHGTRKAEQAPTGNHAVSYFVEQITKLWNKQVETILETGRLLIKAKQELPHGEFQKMIGGGPIQKGPLPFGPRAAQMLMTIARHPILSEAKYVSHLPPSWGTLYDLAGIPDSELIALIKTGQINPGMERSDVKKFHFARFDEVPRSIGVLMDFMNRVLPGELAENVMFNNWTEDWLDAAVRKLPSYVEELLVAVQKRQDEMRKAIDEYAAAAKLKSRG